jgi:hypothetical protein
VREVELCSEFIPVDGNAGELIIQAFKSRLPSFCKGMSCQDLSYISSLLDHSKQVSEIVLPYSLQVPELPAAKANWKYELKDFIQTIEVDAETVRPIHPKDAACSALEIKSCLKGASTWVDLC